MNLSSVQEKNKRLFILAFSLTLLFALLEIIYGFISGSLMIIGDGVHMSSDAISLGLSLIAAILALKVSNNTYTFGYKRFEPIAAFINGITLVLIPLVIIFEAVRRLINPVEILPKEMLVVGIIGLVINGVVGLILSKAESNLNVRSAMLHVLADMFTSFSAVVAALCIMFFDLTWVDPVGSVITSLIIISGGIRITKEAFRILMEGVPDDYSVVKIKEDIQTFTKQPLLDVKLWCVNEQEPYVLLTFEASEEHAIDFERLKEQLSQKTEIPMRHIYINYDKNAS